MKLQIALLRISIVLLVFCAAAITEPLRADIPRTVLGIYYAKKSDGARQSAVHRFAAMPLNHLGIKIIYHNLREGLPKVDNPDELLGVLTWLQDEPKLDFSIEYLEWLEKQARAGKKIVIMGFPGFIETSEGTLVPLAYINRFFRLIGIRYTGEWIRFTYDIERTLKDKNMVDYERQFAGYQPPYYQFLPVSADVRSHLVARKANHPDSESHLIMTSAGGGFAAKGYALYFNESSVGTTQQWYLNPFEFFRLAFDTDKIPKPDTTTLAGRRIYYSHVDGDGWLNVTTIEKYQSEGLLSSEVILKEVVQPYPNLPVTIAPVAGEIDTEWVGTPQSRKVARLFFSLPQVEIGSHTYSHPFDWGFFSSGDPEKERPLLNRYPHGSWEKSKARNRYKKLLVKSPIEEHSYSESNVQDSVYKIPRAYASLPFDLKLEISGAADFLNQLAPKSKKTSIIMWSGNTTPFEEAIRQSRLAGLRNINGGDSRFDREYPSVSWVSPVGRIVGREIQVYASNSNENTYTQLWGGRYYGFRFLVDTLKNTETPIRLKPINLYYHIYSGERLASLNAILSNLTYIQTQEIIPIRTSRFSDIATGFYTTRIRRTDATSWEILDRGHLQTIRFDNAVNQVVDFSRSNGVIGYRRANDSLYIYLDEAITTPEITIRENTRQPSRFYLESARWRVWGLNGDNRNFSFNARGWGNPELIWRVVKEGWFNIRVTEQESAPVEYTVSTTSGGRLDINPEDLKNSGAFIQVRYIGDR